MVAIISKVLPQIINSRLLLRLEYWEEMEQQQEDDLCKEEYTNKMMSNDAHSNNGTMNFIEATPAVIVAATLPVTRITMFPLFFPSMFQFVRGQEVGNFSHHEVFAVGGTNSVRGCEKGAMGSGRSYVVVCGEISFPFFGQVYGALFAGHGTELVLVLTHLFLPGGGCGYEIGIRAGPLQLHYASKDKQARRFHIAAAH
ncbi:outer envelope protein 80, chloroplastic-like [Silene latifolia]|uniref:outer envelope protein 80, chloroplastic-like n=1 Tax=Silene latifolia TaxID=37657 RepID=UPI003D784801